MTADRPYDWGDEFPADAADSMPTDPTAGYSQIQYSVKRHADPQKFRAGQPFNPNLDVKQHPTPLHRQTSCGIVLSEITNANDIVRQYQVVLSDGRIVTATVQMQRPDQTYGVGAQVIVTAGYVAGTHFMVGPAFYNELNSLTVTNEEALKIQAASNVTFDYWVNQTGANNAETNKPGLDGGEGPTITVGTSAAYQISLDVQMQAPTMLFEATLQGNLAETDGYAVVTPTEAIWGTLPQTEIGISALNDLGFSGSLGQTVVVAKDDADALYRIIAVSGGGNTLFEGVLYGPLTTSNATAVITPTSAVWGQLPDPDSYPINAANDFGLQGPVNRKCLVAQQDDDTYLLVQIQPPSDILFIGSIYGSLATTDPAATVTVTGGTAIYGSLPQVASVSAQNLFKASGNNGDACLVAGDFLGNYYLIPTTSPTYTLFWATLNQSLLFNTASASVSPALGIYGAKPIAAVTAQNTAGLSAVDGALVLVAGTGGLTPIYYILRVPPLVMFWASLQTAITPTTGTVTVSPLTQVYGSKPRGPVTANNTAGYSAAVNQKALIAQDDWTGSYYVASVACGYLLFEGFLSGTLAANKATATVNVAGGTAIYGALPAPPGGSVSAKNDFQTTGNNGDRCLVAGDVLGNFYLIPVGASSQTLFWATLGTALDYNTSSATVNPTIGVYGTKPTSSVTAQNTALLTGPYNGLVLVAGTAGASPTYYILSVPTSVMFWATLGTDLQSTDVSNQVSPATAIYGPMPTGSVAASNAAGFCGLENQYALVVQSEADGSYYIASVSAPVVLFEGSFYTPVSGSDTTAEITPMVAVYGPLPAMSPISADNDFGFSGPNGQLCLVAGYATGEYILVSTKASGSSGLLFTLPSDLDVTDESIADCPVTASWGRDPGGSTVTVFNMPSTNGGSYALTGVHGGYGIAIWDDSANLYRIVLVEHQAVWVNFELTASLTSGSAGATRTDYSDGVDPGSAITVVDSQGLFSYALSGAKGIARWDSVNKLYEVVECQSQAGFVMLKITSAISGNPVASGSGTVVSYWGTQQDVQNPGSSVNVFDNSQKIKGNTNDYVIASWDTTNGRYQALSSLTDGFVTFTLTDNMTTGSAPANVVTVNGSLPNMVGDPIKVKDPAGLFTQALQGAAGIAIYDPVNGYVVVECQTAAGFIDFTVTGFGDPGQFLMTPASGWGTQQDSLATGSPSSVFDSDGRWSWVQVGMQGVAALDSVDGNYYIISIATRGIPFYNATGNTLLPYDVFASGGISSGILNAVAVSTSLQSVYYLNGSQAVDLSQYGSALPFGDVKIASISAANGDGWGPSPGAATLSRGFPTIFRVAGDDGTWTEGNLLEEIPSITVLTPSGGIPAYSSSTKTPGSASCVVYANTSSGSDTLTSTTFTAVVKNLSTSAIPASTMIEAIPGNGKWFAVSASGGTLLATATANSFQGSTPTVTISAVHPFDGSTDSSTSASNSFNLSSSGNSATVLMAKSSSSGTWTIFQVVHVLVTPLTQLTISDPTITTTGQTVRGMTDGSSSTVNSYTGVDCPS